MRGEGWKQDQAGREKLLSDAIRKDLPTGSQFKLTSMTGWDQHSGTIHVQGDVDVTGAIVSAGHRLLLTAAVLHAGQGTYFQQASRIYPVYYRFPFQLRDEVVMHFPPEFRADSLPNSVKMPAGTANYEFEIHPEGNGLRLTRDLSISAFLFGVADYPALQDFYAKAHQDDERQIMLVASAKP